LTLPSATGAVNLPVYYSYTAEVSAPFKQILLTFGDNQDNVDLGASILSGKYYWQGTFYHTYTRQGNFSIKLKVTDQTNAFKEVTRQVTIGSIEALNDHTAPTGSITINDGAASTNTRGVALRITGQDNSGGVGIYRYRLSSDGVNWGNWESVNPLGAYDIPQPSVSIYYAWQLSEGAGTKTVYAQLKDAAENVSNVFSDTIQLQATGLQVSGALPPPPQVPSVVAMYQNPPKPRGSITITSRSGNNIAATFSATNDWAIPVDQMALSFDGTNWTGWMPFEDNKQIDISGHLSATKLYVTYGDKAGGQSPAYSADIPAASSGGTTSGESTSGSGTAVSGETTQGVSATASGSGAATTQTGSSSTQATAAGSQGAVAQQQATVPATQGISHPQATVQAQGALTGMPPIMKRIADLEILEIKLPEEIYRGEIAPVEVEIRSKSKLEAINCILGVSCEDGFEDKREITCKGDSLQTVKFNWQPQKEGRFKLTAVIKPLEGIEEKDMRNNTKEAKVTVRAKEEITKRPAEFLAPIDISIADLSVPAEVFQGEQVEIGVRIRNNSPVSLNNCILEVACEDGFKDKKQLSLAPNQMQLIKINWQPQKEGRFKLFAVIKPPEGIEEKDTRNNTQDARIKVMAKKELPQTPGSIIEAEKTRPVVKIDIAISEIVLPGEIYLGKPAEIVIMAENFSEAELKDCLAAIEIDDGFREKRPFSLKPLGKEKILFNWTPKKEGRLTLNAIIRPPRGIGEGNNRNNEARRIVEAIPAALRIE